MTDAPPPPVWTVQTTGPSTIAYGGFWIRVVAYIIDAILLSIASGILNFATGISFYGSNFSFFANGASLVIGWLYFALMESSERGATVGKMAVGLRVVTD